MPGRLKKPVAIARRHAVENAPSSRVRVTPANGGMQELRVSDLQIRRLFTERVAALPGVADMLVEMNDEQRPRWFLSCSVRLWRGRVGTVALPLVDFLQPSSHERCLVVLGQAFGVAERRDALLIAQHANRPRPVGARHATIQPERIDDPQYRLPDIVVWERLVRHRAGTTDLYSYVLVLSQGEQLGKIGPNVGGDRRASRLQQAEMVDNDDRIAVSLDVRQPFVQDAPAKQIDRQAVFGRGRESAVQTGMVRVHRQAGAHSDSNAPGALC